jgi:CRP-like cAMP-binding protein
MKAVFKSGSGKNPSDQFLVTYLMGDIIFSEGDLGTEMYIVQTGIVEIFKKIGGRQKVLATLEKGDFFGEMSVLEDASRTASARAKTDVELVRINQTTFDQMIKTNTEIAVRMLRKLSRRLRETTELLEEALGRKLEPVESPSSSGAIPAVARQEHRIYRLVAPDKKSEFYLTGTATRIGRADPVRDQPRRRSDDARYAAFDVAQPCPGLRGRGRLLRHGRNRRHERHLRQRPARADGIARGDQGRRRSEVRPHRSRLPDHPELTSRSRRRLGMTPRADPSRPHVRVVERGA